MINTIKKASKGLMIALAFAIIGQSCKKTETIPFDREPENQILEYRVENSAELLYGVIDDTDNTITVSLPYYLSIDFISPKIKLQDGAKLIDKSGNEIDLKEDLELVPFDSVGYTYNVKDKANQIRKYTLITKILPHQTPLTVGYKISGSTIDTSTPKDVIINSEFIIYGNFQSSSRNGALTLTDLKTNKVIPNALTITNLIATGQGHQMTLKAAASLDSGSYALTVTHQGRTAIAPNLHLIHKKPKFEYLGKEVNIGDVVTIKVLNSWGVNTGVKRLYIILNKQLFSFPGASVPTGFPANLFDVPIEVEIVSQNRTEIQFKFPDLPVGRYVNYLSVSGSEGLLAASFGFFMDFNSTDWGNGNIVTMAPSTFEIKPKK